MALAVIARNGRSTTKLFIYSASAIISEARDLLTPVYAWFADEFDTADLNEAKTLLDTLTEPAIAAEG